MQAALWYVTLGGMKSSGFFLTWPYIHVEGARECYCHILQKFELRERVVPTKIIAYLASMGIADRTCSNAWATHTLPPSIHFIMHALLMYDTCHAWMGRYIYISDH